MVPAPASPAAFPLRPHPHLYEINTWAWLEQLSARASRQIGLRDVPDAEWDRLAQMGFDVVWLMGVWQRSPRSREIAMADPGVRSAYDRALPGWKPSDVIGSAYSVKRYTPDPRIGTWDDLHSAREKLRKRGMALFLDFVGNHTALDHPWTREHPDFYVQGSAKDFENDPGSFCRIESDKGVVYVAYGRDPYFPPWTDTAQLNHFSAGMRSAQLAELQNIARHCDGVRCDMAMLHLRDIFARVWNRFLHDTKAPETEFWQDAHGEVPQLILLAEAYWGTEQRLLELGFSFVYDKNLYDAVRDMNVNGVRGILMTDVRQQSRFARFLENHDEPRSVTVFGKQRLPSSATLMGTLPGMRFYHQGEFEGRTVQIPVSLRIGAAEPADPFCLDIFGKIIGGTNEPVFHQGQWRLVGIADTGDGTSANLIAYEWSSPANSSTPARKVIAVNLKENAACAWVHFDDWVDATADYIFYDELHDVRYPRKGSDLREGLFVRLEGFQAHLFDVTLSPAAEKGTSNAR